MNQIVEQFKLYKRAKKLEEMGNTDRALDLYLELHEKYDPNTSDAYERPAILLERKKRYEEALALCEAAIEEINNDRVSGTVDKFNRRKESILEKLKEEPKKEIVQKNYKFGIIGFRKKKKLSMLIATLVYLFLILIGFLYSFFFSLTIVGIIYTFQYLYDFLQLPDRKTKISLAILLSIATGLLIIGAINIPQTVRNIVLESKEASLEGGENIFKNNDDRPLITETHIEDAIKIITIEIEVKDASIQVSEDSIAFALEIYPATDKEKAIVLSEKFVEALAHRVAQDVDIKAPSFKSMGQLYDYYTVFAVAGQDDQNITAKGKKTTSSKFINWYD